MAESIIQHVITKGGEFYSISLGEYDDFTTRGYMSKVTNVPWGNLIEVAEDTYISFDVITRLWFTRTEVH